MRPRFNTDTPRVTRRAVLRAGAMGGLVVTGTSAFAKPALVRPRDDRFVIGVLAPVPPDANAVRTLVRTITRAIGREPDVEHFAQGDRLVDAAALGRIALSTHTALTFAAATLACSCLIPLVRPLSRDGAAGLRAVVMVRGASPAQTLDDLAGAAILGAGDAPIPVRVARVAIRTALKNKAAPIYPGPGATSDPERFAGGAADALLGFEHIGSGGERLAPSPGGSADTAVLVQQAGAADIRTIWRSDPIWNGPVALHADHAALASTLGRTLLGLRGGSIATQALGFNDAVFTPARGADYRLLPSLLRQ